MATPMIGGIITSAILELLIFPAIYFIWRSRQLLRREPAQKKQTVLQELRS
jgi:Cu(I)/Ag(I) efflux system membrane protein CusA/SilA